MLDRISPIPIIKGHFQAFRDKSNENGSLCWFEIVLVILIPAALSFGVVFLDGEISSVLNTNILTGFSILSGMLANMAVLLVSGYDGISEKGRNHPRRSLIRETFFHASYGFILSLLCVLFTITYEMVKSKSFPLFFPHLSVGLLWSFFILFLVFSFIHTALMIVKRFAKVINDHLS